MSGEFQTYNANILNKITARKFTNWTGTENCIFILISHYVDLNPQCAFVSCLFVVSGKYGDDWSSMVARLQQIIFQVNFEKN